MKEENTEETFFREIMSKSKLQVPFSDFDDKVMSLIEIKRLEKASASKDIKLSWIFFFAGGVFGIIISIVLSKSQESFMGISLDNFTIPFQIIFSFLFVTQINNLFDYYKKIKTKR